MFTQQNKIKRSKTQTITEQVYEQLEQKIVFCEIEPGSILTEKEICDMLGAGRTPVHEALLLLSKRFCFFESSFFIKIEFLSMTTNISISCCTSTISKVFIAYFLTS